MGELCAVQTLRSADVRYGLAEPAVAGSDLRIARNIVEPDFLSLPGRELRNNYSAMTFLCALIPPGNPMVPLGGDFHGESLTKVRFTQHGEVKVVITCKHRVDACDQFH